MKAWLGVLIAALAGCTFKEYKNGDPQNSGFNDKLKAGSGWYQTLNSEVFQPKCLSCHNSNSATNNGIDFSTYETLMDSRGIIIPFQPERSPLFLSVQSGKMPKDSSPLSIDEIKGIGRWIELGAKQFDQVQGPAPTPTPVPPEIDEVDFAILSTHFLAQNCIKCHNATKSDGHVDFSSYFEVMNNFFVDDLVIPGNVEGSLMWSIIIKGKMPPESHPPPTPYEMDILKKWILQGARETL